jgi:hypothetical protein
LTTPQLHTDLTTFIEEAIVIRFETEVPSHDAVLPEIHSVMIQAQINLSKLEALLSKAIRAKSVLDRKIAHLKMVYQEAWDKAIVKVNRRPTLGDFATGKEKAAEANLATLDTARVLRAAEESQSFANEAVDIIRLHYYGLDKLRQDLRKRLDSGQVEYFTPS